MKKLSILYTCHLETNSRNVIRKKIETNSKNGFLVLVVLKQMSLEIEVFLVADLLSIHHTSLHGAFKDEHHLWCPAGAKGLHALGLGHGDELG